jgi:RND family efflux transporter MFP subunit
VNHTGRGKAVRGFGWLGIGLVALGGAWAVVTRRPAAMATPEVARVTRQDLETVVKATGVVRPVTGAEVRVGSRASGVVRRLHARIGDRVVKGQLLAELESGELMARRDQAAASLASVHAARDFAVAEIARKRRLAAAEALAPSELELAERSVAVARAAVEEARANLAFTRTQLGQTRIEAPIAGVVSSVATQEGETVSASLTAPTFVTIVDLARLEVWAYVDETDIGRIRVGLPARFSVDAYPDRELEGRVEAIYPKAEIRDNVVNYVAVVRFPPPPQDLLRPEMTASVRLVLDHRGDALTVPRRAVRRERGRTFVLVHQAGRLTRRWVSTGSRDEQRVEIVEGLGEGDVVVIGEPAAEVVAAD